MGLGEGLGDGDGVGNGVGDGEGDGQGCDTVVFTTLLYTHWVKFEYSFAVIRPLFKISKSPHCAGMVTNAVAETHPDSPGSSSCAFHVSVRVEGVYRGVLL